MSLVATGKKKSKEHCNALKASWHEHHGDNFKNKISLHFKGKKLSDLHKNKLSIAKNGKYYFFRKDRNKYIVVIKGKKYGSFLSEKEAQEKVKELKIQGVIQ